MKPRKSWEPVYRFGGNPADVLRASPLGQTSRIVVKKQKSKRIK